MIKIKRIYTPAEPDDGFRVLVDRLWPRGLSKDKARVDLWLKDIAPSDELRKWFSHRVERFNEFKDRYRNELLAKQDLLHNILKLEEERGVVTLLYAARDSDNNNARVLLDVLNEIKTRT